MGRRSSFLYWIAIPTQKTVSVHRMVQAVMRWSMEEEERRTWAEQVVRVVNAAFPSADFETWPICERLLPHAQVCAGFIDEFDISSAEAGRLLNQTAYYLDERARFKEAEPLFRRALGFDEKLWPRPPEVALTSTISPCC